MPEERIICPEHGVSDCSPLLNGCSLVNRLYDERQTASKTKLRRFNKTAWAMRRQASVFDLRGPEWADRARDMRESADELDPPQSVIGTNLFPLLDVRYAAAKQSNLGDQLRSDELTERVRIELENAFTAGALWQYHRVQELANRETSE